MLQSSIKIRPIIDLTAEVGLDESHLVIDLGSEEDLEERHLWSILPICLCTAFTCPDPKSAKKRVKPLVSFCAFGICTRKSCWWNVGEIGPWKKASGRKAWVWKSSWNEACLSSALTRTGLEAELATDSTCSHQSSDCSKPWKPSRLWKSKREASFLARLLK